MTKDFLIVVYDYLEVGSDYRSDLVDLFGTPDGSRKGHTGSIDRPARVVSYINLSFFHKP